MEAVCKNCNLTLKLPAAALPAGARLYCPKCSKALEIKPDGAQSAPGAVQAASQPPVVMPVSTPPSAVAARPPAPQPPQQSPAPQAGMGGAWDSFLSGVNVPPPSAPPFAAAPAPVALGIPAAPAYSPALPQTPAYQPQYQSQPAVPGALQNFAPQGFPGMLPSDRMTIPVMPTVVVSPPQAPVGAVGQLFSEDIVPDTEGGNEDVSNIRQNLFVKADNVWYGAPEDAPAAPPSPSGPPKIPAGTTSQQVGYIKATESIQVDPSLFEKKEFGTPAAPPPVSKPAPAVPRTGIDAIPGGGGRMELDLGGPASAASLELAVTTPPHPSVSPTSVPDLAIEDRPHRQSSGPIKLVAMTPKKQMSITIPAIVVGVLMVAAGLFYLLAGGTNTRDKFDLTSNTNKTGTLPSTSSASVKPSIGGKVDEKPAEAPKAAEKAAIKETSDEKAVKVAKKPSAASPREPAEPKAPGGGAPKDAGKKAAQEHYSLGNQYFMQQRFDMSAEEYKAAIRSDASYAYAYRGLGAAYARMGKADIAVKQYEMYIRLVPNAPDAEQVKKIINDYYGK